VRITRDLDARYEVDPAQMPEPATRGLYEAWQAVARDVSANPGIDSFMQALVVLSPAIARFFTDVLVMAPDPQVRENRLALLQGVASLSDGIIDLSLMEGF
jgi:glycyl-tRNA synthetase beta subunit